MPRWRMPSLQFYATKDYPRFQDALAELLKLDILRWAWHPGAWPALALPSAPLGPHSHLPARDPLQTPLAPAPVISHTCARQSS